MVTHSLIEPEHVSFFSAEKSSLLQTHNILSPNITKHSTFNTNTMTRILASSISLMAMAATTTQGFAPANTLALRHSMTFVGGAPLQGASSHSADLPYFLDFVDRTPQPLEPTKEVAPMKKVAPKIKAGGAHKKEGVFSPAVLLTKKVVGDDRLNKIRGKVISLHSDVIGNFVETYDTPFGRSVLKSLFEVADVNHNGIIEKDELADALQLLGFSWLQSKQIQGIFQRADLDDNGAIDFDEFMKEAPKTLRTNLIKLAKKNGGDMGLLA
jgi:hypothetical protein